MKRSGLVGAPPVLPLRKKKKRASLLSLVLSLLSHTLSLARSLSLSLSCVCIERTPPHKAPWHLAKIALCIIIAAGCFLMYSNNANMMTKVPTTKTERKTHIDMTESQAAHNRQTNSGWNGYANHRAHTTSLVLSASTGARGNVAILGAGNCNDLDLPSITKAYGGVYVFDIDGEAMNAGVARQRLPLESEKKMFGRVVDLTGDYTVYYILLLTYTILYIYTWQACSRS
jgi:hypothetical protein